FNDHKHVYSPSQENAVKIIINTIQDRIKKHSNSFHIIVLEDLDYIIDPDISSTKLTKNSKLFYWLKEKDFRDIYRELNPRKKEYT
ncbi:22571_t:CDS:1, partial [Gigaspora margarita]